MDHSGLIEVRWKKEELLELRSGNIFHYRIGSKGTFFQIKKTWKNRVVKMKSKSYRVASLNLRIFNRYIDVHIPTKSHERERGRVIQQNHPNMERCLQLLQISDMKQEKPYEQTKTNRVALIMTNT